ncbi:aminotransferase [Roseivivax halodurans JCM 10272]|uniref:cysteine-S-conjugate beta-lyase n=1 Tax=Roseivivax halodurans JCM 10272 TaxID=1449350 RepID=X7EII4_9RHOB|nr:MalY/PatB family protein [Roseivivax halodurans]ETX15737.1 aminotransferase [Roseivivax halodurans JCM 10272]
MSSRFDEEIARVGTHSAKWDMMETIYGVSPEDGIAMWVADMDFRPPDCVQRAVQAMADHGVYGYFGNDAPYREAICWWMCERHGWEPDPASILTTNGLVNGVGLAVDTWTEPGDGVVLFTPVYHAFGRVIRSAGREVVECPLAIRDGVYTYDFDAYDAVMTGREKMVVLCSPHNPGGRVWTRDELQGVAAFAKRHDLILVSDEIHHDLVMPGQTHVPMTLAAPEIEDQLVMMTATTKTFNIAGCHTGNVIIPDAGLRKAYAQRMAALGTGPNAFGIHMATAAYSAEGAAWVDELSEYLDGNRRLLDEMVNAIPGVRSMPMEATYLAWVDFSGTGMEPAEFRRRVEAEAKLAVNHGETFGLGGETFLRFNFATPRARVEEAGRRLQSAFADLQ